MNEQASELEKVIDDINNGIQFEYEAKIWIAGNGYWSIRRYQLKNNEQSFIVTLETPCGTVASYITFEKHADWAALLADIWGEEEENKSFESIFKLLNEKGTGAQG